jgi:hypothetical protein
MRLVPVSLFHSSKRHHSGNLGKQSSHTSDTLVSVGSLALLASRVPAYLKEWTRQDKYYTGQVLFHSIEIRQGIYFLVSM